MVEPDVIARRLLSLHESLKELERPAAADAHALAADSVDLERLARVVREDLQDLRVFAQIAAEWSA